MAEAVQRPLLLSDLLIDLARLDARRAAMTSSQARAHSRARVILARPEATEAGLAEAAYELRYANGSCLLDLQIRGSVCRPVPIDPAWLTPAVLSVAQAADEERLPGGDVDPDLLAVLSDALIEAGCTDADILGHCRGGDRHARGCWVVDALLVVRRA